jgi:hypothetical protein
MTSTFSHQGAAAPCSSTSIVALPVRVRVAQTAEDMSALCLLREEAYSKHRYSSTLKSNLGYLNDADRAACLLIAEDKATGEVLGTIRLTFSLHSKAPLLENMPVQEVGSDSFVYPDRFAVKKHAHAKVVSLALLKSVLLFAQVCEADWILGSALKPLVPKYAMVGLRALVAPSAHFYAKDLHEHPYLAMGERVRDIPATVRRDTPPIAVFLYDQTHPDLVVTKS